MRIRLLSAVSAALLLLPACKGGDITSPDNHTGTYALESVNGLGLPYLKEETALGRIDVVTGSLSLQKGTYHGEIVEQRVSDAGTDSVSVFSNGTYKVVGDQATFIESGSGSVYFGTVSDGRVTATLNDVTFGFIKR
jgi:hypothetical protein